MVFAVVAVAIVVAVTVDITDLVRPLVVALL